MEELVRRSLLLGSLGVLTASFTLIPQSILDPDIGWHIRTGQWILEHWNLPNSDPFSAYGEGKDWIAYSWLFEIILYLFHARLDLVGLPLFTATLTFPIAGVLLFSLRRHNRDPGTLVVLTAFGILGMAGLLQTPRPWLISILFMTIELDLLLEARSSGRTGRLYLLPILFWLWASMAIQFIYGLYVLGLFLLEPALAHVLRKPGLPMAPAKAIDRKVWIAAGLAVAATWLTPYYHELYLELFKVIGQTGVFTTIGELRAMPFRSFDDWVVLAVAIGAAFVLGRKRELDGFLIPLFLTGLVLAFRARRDVWFLLLPSLVILASALPRPKPGETSFTRPQLLVSLLLTLLVTSVGMRIRHVDNSQLTRLLADNFPQRAIDVARLHRLQGPLYNHYDWGGYLIWQLPEHKVSLDGRANLHGDERIERSLRTWSGKPGWADDPELLGANLVIAQRDQPLCSLLKLDPRFALFYEDNVAALFISRPTPKALPGIAAP